MPQPGDTG